jgi:Tub family
MDLNFSRLAPMWNENSQVYQLDFGGRVTQESAKNFQIEFRGKQVSAFPVFRHRDKVKQLIISFYFLFSRLCNLDESMATLIH